MRSLYHINKAGEILEIKRFDLDNNLQQIFYPLGNRMPKKEWTDITMSDYLKTIEYNAIIEENYYKETNVYDLSGKILECTYSNLTYNNANMAGTKQLYIYNASNNLVRREEVDLSCRFVSEERFYYKNNILRHYEKYESPKIDVIAIERFFDSTGRNIESHGLVGIPEKPTIWKYYYNSDGLSTKDEYYINSKIESELLYIYNSKELIKK